MSGIALALIISGVVLIRGALKGFNPTDSFKDIFDRTRGGAGIASRADIDELDRLLLDVVARDPLTEPDTKFLVEPTTRQDFPN